MEQFEEAIQKRVAVGAAFLDKHLTGWADNIKHPVDINCPFRCVLGQIYGEFHKAMGYLGLSPRVAQNLGFMMVNDDQGDCDGYFEFLMLNKAWEQAINERSRHRIQIADIPLLTE